MQIRRIDQTEAEQVTALWDAAAQAVPDGGALRPRGRRAIAAMLMLAATHPLAACFVAEHEGVVAGFVVAEVDHGLLPGTAGAVQELVAPDAATYRELAEHARGWLHERGAQVVRLEVPEDEPEALARAAALGWAREAVRFAASGDDDG
jgi:hypothetical protein